MKTLLLISGLLLLFAVEILRVYFIMPFPGSQHNNTIDIAYWIAGNILWLRIVGIIMILFPLVHIFRRGRLWKKIIVSAVVLLYGFIFFMFNFRFEADKMFYQPEHKNFATATANAIDPERLVIGVSINGEAKAYPIQVIGYHHQVRDTVGNTPIMVTYCTVCRTGRVFSPFVNDKPETFRLVGMDHFNAMFEDATTGSWWQQATGEAITGELKGTRLKEIPSRQSTLAAWFTLHPNSTVLQPDTVFKKDYDDLVNYDIGTIEGSLEKRDSASWQFKSWVIGVVHNNKSRAYDWNALVERKMLQDSLPGLPLVITLAKDTATFYVLNRMLHGAALQFNFDNTNNELKDVGTGSTWSSTGLCTEGSLKGEQLAAVQAYQEFWHSWQSFHPGTDRFK